MIDFTVVSREIRSIVSRRRELLTFLGSTFAALGLVLENVLHGDLPKSLKNLEEHAFATYAVLLLVPCLILGLRLAKLNAGLVLNGLLFTRLMHEQDFTRKAPLATKAPGPNLFGVSFQMFLLADTLAGFAAGLLGLALQWDAFLILAAGIGVVLAGIVIYCFMHYRAAAFALQKSAAESCQPFTRDQWEAHQAGSLEDANHDMLTILALIGLIVFSAFEGMTGLGRTSKSGEITVELVREQGATVYSAMMAVTCLMGLVAYLRLRLAVGQRSLELDPSDRPFRPFRLTDSLLGYLLLAFLFALSVNMLVFTLVDARALWIIDGAAFGGAVLVEQTMLMLAGRQQRASL